MKWSILYSYYKLYNPTNFVPTYLSLVDFSYFFYTILVLAIRKTKKKEYSNKVQSSERSALKYILAIDF